MGEDIRLYVVQYGNGQQIYTRFGDPQKIKKENIDISSYLKGKWKLRKFGMTGSPTPENTRSDIKTFP